MNTYHDLFRLPSTEIDEGSGPDPRSDLLPEEIARSKRLRVWSSRAAGGDRLVVGVSTWSGYDMILLDLIEESAGGPLRVDVFDTNTCHSSADVDERVPGVGRWANGPFAGHWVGDRLVEARAGHDARELVARVCGIPNDTLLERLDAVYTQK